VTNAVTRRRSYFEISGQQRRQRSFGLGRVNRKLSALNARIFTMQIASLAAEGALLSEDATNEALQNLKRR
jgi:hypothetical protein